MGQVAKKASNRKTGIRLEALICACFFERLHVMQTDKDLPLSELIRECFNKPKIQTFA